MRTSYQYTEKGVVEFVQLSNRERQILNLLFDGLNYKQIADAMEFKENTLRSRIFKLCSNLRVSGKQGLMAWAHSHPLVLEDGNRPVQVGIHHPGCECGITNCWKRIRI
jgi:DNA-binding NarL/FixJ family response regulator